MRKTGDHIVQSVAGDKYRAFVPCPLPPDPPLDLTDDDRELLELTNRAIGRLDGVTRFLPDPSLFAYFYVRKEAVLSSQIEGTQSSLSDLMLHEAEEAPGVPMEDVEEVSCYVRAMDYAVHRIRADGLPICLRLIRETHSLLLARGRGERRAPGEFRRSQNWIGGSRPGNAVYVPPPPEKVMECMAALEKFLHDDPRKTPTLPKAGLAHAQFESIHPFLDGNGRMGRLLITLLLCAENALEEPILYLSLFFKRNRPRYYELLQGVRDRGDWEGWIRFYLEGVRETCEEAVETALRILGLFERDEQAIQSHGASTVSALRVNTALHRRPILSISKAAAVTGLSFPTASSAMRLLAQLGIVREMTGKSRGRLFAYQQYLDILNEGGEI
jgi:Fic family protein